MEETISLRDALVIIDKKDKEGNAFPFDISFRSLNGNSKTGGKLYEYKQVKKLIARKSSSATASIKAVQSGVTGTRKPNHFFNRTRNLELQNGDIKKIHIRLIISINGKKVIY
ncbi:hypothetical protein V2605_03960 [Tenacibaculum maritimum]|uniref:hypothetical protein n=1 Tax=Tenacibaculum maritimum TaxID=107401 RepID=UPI0038770684